MSTETDDVTNDTVDIREQLLEAFDEMNYPIELPIDMAAGFRSWDNTSFGGDHELTSVRLQLYLSDAPSSFPYESADELVAAIIKQLVDREIIRYDDEDAMYKLIEQSADS